MPNLDIRRSRHLLSSAPGRASMIRLMMVRLLLIGVFIALTNFGFWQRVNLLLDNGRFDTLVPFLAIWALAIVSIFAAALQPKLWLRAAWGVLIAMSAAVAWGYHRASQSELNVFDML